MFIKTCLTGQTNMGFGSYQKNCFITNFFYPRKVNKTCGDLSPEGNSWSRSVHHQIFVTQSLYDLTYNNARVARIPKKTARDTMSRNIRELSSLVQNLEHAPKHQPGSFGSSPAQCRTYSTVYSRICYKTLASYSHKKIRI